MSGVVHELNASITSALVIKPSTVYVLRVENTQTHVVWHLRRSFSDFVDLREKFLALVESNSSLVKDCQSTFPHLFKRFPRRHLFGSRLKRIVQHRTNALNRFLAEALAFVSDMKRQQKIALYFSMMTHLESFLDCAQHLPNQKENQADACSSPCSSNFVPFTLTRSARSFPYWPTTYWTPSVAPDGTTHGNGPAVASDDHEDEDPEKLMLKKASSCYMQRDMQSGMRMEENIDGGSYWQPNRDTLIKLYDDASDPRQQHSEDNQYEETGYDHRRVRSRSAADAWAARIEIAGLSHYKAIQENDSYDLQPCYELDNQWSWKDNEVMHSLAIPTGSPNYP